MTNDDDIDLNNLIAIEPTEITSPSDDKPPEPTEFEKDLAYARDCQIEAVKQAQVSMAELASVAYQSQNYLAYEKLSMMLKTVSEMNKDFIDISRQKRDEAAPKVEADGEKTVNNNLYVGSTADILQLLDQLKEKKNESH